MAYNISEIKKLPVQERLKIIDELWDSIDDEYPDSENESPEIIALLEERLNAYKNGQVKSYSWEEVKKKLKARREEGNKNNSDD